MHLPSKKVFFGESVFDVWQDVYEPAEDSVLFAQNLSVRQGDCVLDLGTGCGIQGVVAAAKAAKVVATDINPYAVRCARSNARLNRVLDKMLFVQGDLFTPLKADSRFDLILFNAPYLPAEHREGDSWLERAWAGGGRGRQVIDSFISKSPTHLKPNGRILLLQSTLSGLDETLNSLGEGELRARIIAEQSLPFFESVILIEAKR
jgi:release factor glutamine methyltransferase